MYSNTYNKTQIILYNYTHCFSTKHKSQVYTDLPFVKKQKHGFDFQ